MSTTLFPPSIDVDPNNVVKPTDVFDALVSGGTGRWGLVAIDVSGNRYYMSVTRRYDLSGRDTLSPHYTEEKAGRVPWGIVVQDGYQRDQYEISGYLYASPVSEAEMYAEIARFRAVILDQPAIALYSPLSFGTNVYERIPGMYRYVSGSFKVSWTTGHKSAVAEFSISVQQVSVGSLILDTAGNVTTIGAL